MRPFSYCCLLEVPNCFQQSRHSNLQVPSELIEWVFLGAKTEAGCEGKLIKAIALLGNETRFVI